MKISFIKIKKWAMTGFGALFLALASPTSAFADGYGITMSPMNQKIILAPGETYIGSFNVSNSTNNSGRLKYNISVQPFFVDEDYNIQYEETEDLNQIVDWTTVDIESGILDLGESQKINFTINVPNDAPAGGQYEAITVTSANDGPNADNSDDDLGVNISQSIAVAHIVYAEITGTTRHSGEILDINVPSFIFDGNITAGATIKNTGNIHEGAVYKLQIFPLFSNEEIFTNEEDPDTQLILPNRTLTNVSIWEQTPTIGIFNIRYVVEFDGTTTEVTKLVIKCPLWLLFIILLIIICLIIWIVIRIRKSKKSQSEA